MISVKIFKHDSIQVLKDKLENIINESNKNNYELDKTHYDIRIWRLDRYFQEYFYNNYLILNVIKIKGDAIEFPGTYLSNFNKLINNYDISADDVLICEVFINTSNSSSIQL